MTYRTTHTRTHRTSVPMRCIVCRERIEKGERYEKVRTGYERHIKCN